MKIDMQSVTNQYLEGKIDKGEFNRLNALQLIAADGHKIMAQETAGYLLELLTSQAPAARDFEKYLKEIDDQREEIAKAFVAAHGANPEDVEQYEIKDPKSGLSVWRIRKIPKDGIQPLPIEVVEALRESERALIGMDACGDPECGSDQCAALQMIRALLPPGEFIPTVSCAEVRRANREMMEPKAPAARASLTLEQAGLKLEQAVYLMANHAWEGQADKEKAAKVGDLLDAFYDRWFTFHEENLTAIEGAFPAPLDEMGGTIVIAIENMVKRYSQAERDAEKYRQILADRAEGSGDAMSKINAVVQAWYASGVSRAMETAAARLAEIGKILNAEAGQIIAKSRAQDKTEDEPALKNQKAIVEILLKDLEGLRAYCQENHEVLGIRPGASYPDRCLEILKDWVNSYWLDVQKDGGAVPFGELGTCKTCGQLPGNHEGMEHAFRGKGQATA